MEKRRNFDDKLPAEMLENHQITPMSPENPPLASHHATILGPLYYTSNV